MPRLKEGLVLSPSERRARVALQNLRGPVDVPEPAEIIRRLEDRGTQGHTKRELLRLLAQAVDGNGDRKSIMVCITLLNDEDSSVRMAAVETLESVIPMRIARSFDGRREAIAALGRVCVDWNARARAVALRVLVAIADKSDFDVQAAVMGEVLKDATELPLFARIAAVEAVPIVTRSGDPYAVRQLIQELGDEDPAVRLTTVVALRKLAKRGDAQERAAPAVRPRRCDASALCWARGPLARRAEYLAARRQIVKPLCALLADVDERVTVPAAPTGPTPARASWGASPPGAARRQVAALQALQEKVLPEGSEDVVKAVVGVLGRRAELSLPVLRCVGAIAQRGSDRALNLCLVKGNDRDPAVRLLAVEGVARIADGSRVDVTDFLLAKLNRERLQAPPDP